MEDRIIILLDPLKSGYNNIYIYSLAAANKKENKLLILR